MAAKKRAAKGGQKATARKGSERPLPPNPIRPGEVRNPQGINQYTYRRDFEMNIQRLLKTAAPEHVRRLVPESAKHMVEMLGTDATVGEIMAVVTICEGVAWNDQRHVSELLKRLWPAMATGTEDDPIHTKPGPSLEGVTEETLRALLKQHGGT